MSLKSGTNSSSWGYDLSLQTLPDGNYTLTAQVTGTDLVGNQITNTNTLTIEVDTQIPTLIISSNLGIHKSNTANANDNISVSAQFSEEMIQYPKITLTGIASNVNMTSVNSSGTFCSFQIFLRSNLPSVFSPKTAIVYAVRFCL